MSWFTKKNEEKPRTLTQLTPEERSDIEFLLAEGSPVSEIAREFNINPQGLYQLKRASVTGSPRVTTPRAFGGNPDVERIRQDIEKLKAESELEKVKEELEYQRELRKLTLEEKRLDIQARRAELEGDDDEFDIADAADDPENAMWGFFKEIIKRGGVRSGNTPPVAAAPAEDFPPPPPPLDMAKEHSYEDIKLEMELRFSELDLKKASLAPWSMVSSQIKQQFPSITENNLKHIAEVLRHYGHK